MVTLNVAPSSTYSDSGVTLTSTAAPVSCAYNPGIAKELIITAVRHITILFIKAVLTLLYLSSSLFLIILSYTLPLFFY